MTADQQPLFGDVDGEVPASATFKLSGAGIAERAFARGERIAVTATGIVTGIAFAEKDGALQRVHTIRVEQMAEAGDLAADVEDFLDRLDDAREGREQLPMDDEGEPDGTTDGSED